MSWSLLLLPARSVTFTDFLHLQIRIYNLDNSVCEKSEVSRKKKKRHSDFYQLPHKHRKAFPLYEQTRNRTPMNFNRSGAETFPLTQKRTIEWVQDSFQEGKERLDGKISPGRKTQIREQTIKSPPAALGSTKTAQLWQVVHWVLWVYLPTWKLLSCINQRLN